MRGFGSASICSEVRTPHPIPLPSGERQSQASSSARNGERRGFPAYSYKSRGMHCRAVRSGAPILRGVAARMSCRARHCSGCGTRSSARRRQPAASPQQRQCRRHAVACGQAPTHDHAHRGAFLRRVLSQRTIARGCAQFAKNVVTSSAKPVRSKERAGVGPVFRSSVMFRPINQINEGSGTPANAGSPTAASCDAARALLERARLTAFHHGSHLGEYFIPKVSFRPGFLGRGLNGRYPPSPVPVQGCTSRPGRNAGRHDAQAAREQAANPPAGTALAPMTRCASAPRPSRSEDCTGNLNRRLMSTKK